MRYRLWPAFEPDHYAEDDFAGLRLTFQAAAWQSCYEKLPALHHRAKNGENPAPKHLLGRWLFRAPDHHAPKAVPSRHLAWLAGRNRAKALGRGYQLQLRRSEHLRRLE